MLNEFASTYSFRASCSETLVTAGSAHGVTNPQDRREKLNSRIYTNLLHIFVTGKYLNIYINI
jgi:hypothetical protein